MDKVTRFEDPPVARFLFGAPAAAWIWLAARLYLGYEWAHAGWEKVFGAAGSASWLTDGGAQLKGFVGYAIKGAAQGPHSAVNFGWYAAFLRWIESSSYPWMAKVIALGELTIGIALILGLFTGIAAFFAGTLSFSFGLAGVAGVNPAFFLLEVLLILAWRIAGYIGLDRYVLPALGTPWQAGKVFPERDKPTEEAPVRQLA